MSQQICRCPWGESKDSLCQEYHDKEWGVPVHSDEKLFEFLLLEGAQAGLTWQTILKRRGGYREAFAHFDPSKVATFTEKNILSLLQNEQIIRNKLKILSAITNAQCFLKIQEEFGSFNAFLWQFVSGKPIQNFWTTQKEVPVVTKESEQLSKTLKKRGFAFVGPTIIYAYMQAVGLVNDHLVTCFRHKELSVK